MCKKPWQKFGEKSSKFAKIFRRIPHRCRRAANRRWWCQEISWDPLLIATTSTMDDDNDEKIFKEIIPYSRILKINPLDFQKMIEIVVK